MGKNDKETTTEEPTTTGHVNTTENISGAVDEPERTRTRDLTADDRKVIKSEFGAAGANVQTIADKWQLSPEQVFAIAEGTE